MLKFYIIAIAGLLFFGCSDSGQTSSSVENQQKHLSIARAPINSEVSITQKILLEFSTDLNTSTITDNSVYISDDLDNHVQLSLDIESSKIVFTPYIYFKPSTTYTIVVTTDVKSVSGLSLSKDYKYSFTTAANNVDTSSMSFVDIKPANGSTADPKTEITIEFSKNISQASQSSASEIIKVTDSSGTAVEGVIEYFNTLITFRPSAALDANETYTVELAGSVSDMYGYTYAGTQTQWSFSTKEASYSASLTPSANNFQFGYKSLYQYDLNDLNKTAASIIRSVKSYDGNITVAVASENSIELFDLVYDVDYYPYLQHKPNHSYSFPSQINAMYLKNDIKLVDPETYIYFPDFTNKQYISVATMSDGIYTLRIDSTGLVETHHQYYSTPIYDLAFIRAVDSSGYFKYIDKSYAVGPEYGLGMVQVDSNNNIVDSEHATIDGTPLSVVAVKDSNGTPVVYVSDYEGNILKYSEYCEPLDSIGMNGSVRKLALTDDIFGAKNGLMAFNSLGKGVLFNLEDNLSIKANVSLLSSANDVNSFTAFDNNLSNLSKVHVSDSKNGLMIFNSDYNLTQEAVLRTNGHIVSSTFLGDTMATLDQEGVINIFNAISDTKAPTFTYSHVKTTSDMNVTLVFDEYLNPDTINHDSFDLNYDTTISLLLGTPSTPISFLLVPTDDPKVYIIQSNEDLSLISPDIINITVKGTIEDMVGNKYNNGNDITVPYFVN